MPKTTFSSGSPTPTPSPSPSPSSKQQQPPPPPPSKSTSKKRGILLSGTEEATVQERMLAQLAALNDSILPLPSTSAAFVVELRFSDIFKFFICQQNLNLTYKETAAAEQGGGGGGVRDGTGAMRDFNATANPPTALPPSSNNTFLSFFWSSTSTPNTASSYKATVASNNKGRTDSDIIEASKLLEVQRRLALVRRLRLILDLNLDAIPSPSPLEDFASSLSASFPLLVSLDLQMIDQAEISPRLYHPLLEKILEIKLNNVNLVILDSTEESPSYSPLCPAAEEVDLSSTNLEIFNIQTAAQFPKCARLNLSVNRLTKITSSMGISGLPLLHSLNLAKNAIITLTNLIPVAHPSSPSFIIPPSLDALSNRSELALTPVLTHITLLNLSGNQLENLEGIEQIIALKHLDVSNNRVWDVYEVSRLASLPRVESVLVKGNPLTKVEKYRVNIFQYFKERALKLLLDGETVSSSERKAVLSNMTVVSNSNLDASSSSSPPRLSETRKSSYTKKSKKYKQSHASSSSNKKKSSTKRIIIDPTLELDQAIISELVKSRSEEIVVGSFESGGSFSRRDSDSISRSDIPDSRTQSSTSLAFENAPSSPPFQPRMKSSGGGGDGDNSSHHSNSGFTSALSSPLKTKFSIPASELSVAARKLSLKEEPEQQSQTGIFEFSDEVVISPSSSSQPTRIPASRNNYSYPNNLASSKSATSSFSSKHYFTTIASSSSSSPPPPSTATATSALAGTTPPTALVANPSLLGQDLRKKVEALKTEAAGSEKNWIKLYSEMYANDNPATSGQLGTSPVASSLPKSLRDQDKTVATGSDGRIEEEQTPTVGSLLSSSLKSNSSANAVSQSAEVAGDGGGNGNSLSPTRLVLIPNLKSNFKASAVSESSDNAAGQSSKVDQPSSTAASRSYDRKGKSAFSNAEDVDARIGGMDWGATGQTSMLSTSAPKQLQQSISPVLSPISPEASSSSTSQFTSIGPYRKLFEYPRRQQHQSTKRVPASGKASSLLSDPTSKSFLRSTSGPDVEIGSASDIFIISSSKNNNSTHMPSDVRVLPPLSIVAEGSATGAVNNRSPSSITAMSAARAAYAHSGGGSSRSTQHPGINGGRSGWAGGLVAGSSVPHSIPPSLILSRPLASSIVKYTRNGTGSISSKDSTNYTYSVSGYASSYHPSSSRFAGSVYDDGTNNHSNEPTDAVPLPHAPSIPFMEVTNSLKLFLKFQVFESDSENIMAWIPCSFVKQLPLYLTEGPNESFGVLSDPATFRLSESGYLDGKKRDVLSGMAWILSTLASLSSIQRREMASNSGAVNGLAASLLMSSMPSTKRSSAAVNVTTIGGKVKSFTPLQNLDRMHPMEKPCYILLTDSNFYIFKPRFSIPYNPASGINMYSHYVQEALQQVRYDDPNELISLVCKIPLENLGRLDIGPNWQYFTIHHLNSKSSASSPSSTTTANQSTFSSTSSSSSSPESSKKTFTSYTILTRDKEATKLAVESLQTLFYGSSPSLELGRRVDTMNGRVQIVNDQREWFYRYLREQVFLEKDRSRGNILFNGPGLSRKYLDFEEGGMDDSEQPNKKESASKSSSTTGVGNWWSNWFSGGGGSGSTQSIIPPPHPPPASTETSSSPSPHLLPSNHGPYQVINSSEDYDPASNQSTEELESSPSSNILYELVGWVISPLKSSSASSKLPIPPVLRTVSLVGSQDYLYLLLERFDVWPTLLDSESLFESPTSTRPTTSSSISKPRQPKNFAISSLFPKKEEWDMFRGKKGLVSDIILPGSKNSILKCARIKDIVRCERWRAWRWTSDSVVQQVGAESTIEAFLIQNGCIGMCSSTSESSSSSSGKRFGSAFGSGLGLTTSVSWSSSNRGGMASSGGLFGHPSSSSSNRRKNGGGGSTSKHSSCISGNAGGWQWWVRVAFKMHNGSSSSCCTSYQAATESNTSSASVRDSQSSLNGAAVGEYWWDLMFTSMTGVNDFLEHIQALRGVKPDEDELGEMLQVDRIVHHGDIIASTPGAAQIEMEVAEVVAASSAVAIGGSITMEERQDPLEHPFDASPFAQNRKKDGVKFIIGDD